MELLELVSGNIYDIIGLLGVAFYVVSYSALQFGKLDGNSINYCMLNGAAATLVLISLSKDFNLASAIIQIVWISVSLCGLYRYVKRRSEVRSGNRSIVRSFEKKQKPLISLVGVFV
jgi:hypothetical protein